MYKDAPKKENLFKCLLIIEHAKERIVKKQAVTSQLNKAVQVIQEVINTKESLYALRISVWLNARIQNWSLVVSQCNKILSLAPTTDFFTRLSLAIATFESQGLQQQDGATMSELKQIYSSLDLERHGIVYFDILFLTARVCYHLNKQDEALMSYLECYEMIESNIMSSLLQLSNIYACIVPKVCVTYFCQLTCKKDDMLLECSFRIGQQLQNQGLFKEAVFYLRQALLTKPNDSSYWRIFLQVCLQFCICNDFLDSAKGLPRSSCIVHDNITRILLVLGSTSHGSYATRNGTVVGPACCV